MVQLGIKPDKIPGFLRKYYWVFALVLILSLGYHVRSLPGYDFKYPQLQEIDTYFFYRMGEMLISGQPLPEHDIRGEWMTSNFGPEGPNRGLGYLVTIYAYPFIYWILHPLTNVSWYWIGVWIPPFLGILQVLGIYFLAKEMFNREVGILSAAFLAFVPGIIFRTSAGYIEKEPVAGIFMVMGLLFFVKSLKVKEVSREIKWKNIILHPLQALHRLPYGEERVREMKIIAYGVLSGAFFVIMTWSWGGVRVPLLVIAAFVAAALLLNQYSKRLLLGYMSMFLSYLVLGRLITTAPPLISTEMIVCYAAAGLIMLVYAIQRFRLVKEKYMPFLVPVILVIGLAAVGMGSYVLPDLGSWVSFNIDRFFNPLAFGVIPSTVAESQSAGDFFSSLAPSNFGSLYAISAYGLPDFLIWFSMIYFSLMAIFLMAYEFMFKKRSYEFIFSVVFLIFCIFTSLGAIRLAYVLCFPVAITTAYFLVRGGGFAISRTKAMKGRIPLYVKAAVFAVIGIVVALNFASGLVMANGIDTSMSQPWIDVMEWLRDNTAEDAVMLEWWDYGWWYQYVAEKITLVDGGYHNRLPTQDIAQFYTEPFTDKSMGFLKYFRVNYVMVSPDLISKFGAMSKIGNWGTKVDVLPVFGMSNRYQQGEKTVFEYSLGSEQIVVAFSLKDDNGTTGIQNITAVVKSNGGQAYIRYVGLGNQVIDTGRANSIPAMVYVAGDAVVFAPEAVKDCVYVRLYLLNGAGLEDYLKKVYDKDGMKVYEVQYQNFPSNVSAFLPVELRPDTVHSDE